MNILIVGGSSDIGLNLAKYLKDNNYNVIATYNEHEFNISGITSLKCNLLEEKDIEKTIKYVNDKYGRIDVLINMAAIYYDDEFLNLTKEELMNAFEVNLVGAFLMCQAYERNTQNGMVINIGSTDGIDTFNEYNIIYSMTKAALINMTKSISMASQNRIYCLCPNWIDSDSTKKTDKTYLLNELKRINQSRLITKEEFNETINNIINNKNIETGSIIRLDVKEDELWIEKI